MTDKTPHPKRYRDADVGEARRKDGLGGGEKRTVDPGAQLQDMRHERRSKKRLPRGCVVGAGRDVRERSGGLPQESTWLARVLSIPWFGLLRWFDPKVNGHSGGPGTTYIVLKRGWSLTMIRLIVSTIQDPPKKQDPS